MRKRHNTIFLATGLLWGGTVSAQAVPDPVQYIVAPETPGPNQTVYLEAQGVGSFIGSASITWSQNGTVVKSGVGERQYSFTTGPLGSRTTIAVTINSSRGSFSNQWVFSPSLVNLIWEADTTIPPLYRGKALYSAGSNLRVVAYPIVYSGSARIAQSALTYQWSRNGEAESLASGLGRSGFAFSGDQLRTQEEVQVDAYYGAAKVAHGQITIPASEPMVLLYPRDPLRGELFDAAIPSAIRLNGNELTLQAEPYYFSEEAKAGGLLNYAWTLGGEETSGPDSARGILTLRQTGTGTGQAALQVVLQNNSSAQFVQKAETALQLVFGEVTGNALLNFFGL